MIQNEISINGKTIQVKFGQVRSFQWHLDGQAALSSHGWPTCRRRRSLPVPAAFSNAFSNVLRFCGKPRLILVLLLWNISKKQLFVNVSCFDEMKVTIQHDFQIDTYVFLCGSQYSTATSKRTEPPFVEASERISKARAKSTKDDTSQLWRWQHGMDFFFRKWSHEPSWTVMNKPMGPYVKPNPPNFFGPWLLLKGIEHPNRMLFDLLFAPRGYNEAIKTCPTEEIWIAIELPAIGNNPQGKFHGKPQCFFVMKQHGKKSEEKCLVLQLADNFGGE